MEQKTIIDAIKQYRFDSYLVLNTSTSNQRTRRQVNNEVVVYLDENSSKIDYIKGLKTTLYPHQQTAVKAMLDLEQCRSYEVESPKGGNPYKIAYNVGVLSEPVGSGKTIDILSVICLNKIPRAIPDIMELKGAYGKSIYRGFVRCKFKKFIKATIIFVGSSVMKQWESAIKTFTDLKAFSVNSVVELKVLFDMISNRTVNDYDIILVKNGKITVKIKLPDGIQLEDKNKVGQPYIYNLIANLREYCWARIIVDDFDQIRLPHNAGIVRGIFTWYISSTRRKMEYRNTFNRAYQTASELLSHHDYGCANIMYNHFLFKNLNVRNNINYIESTTNIPNPKYHIVTFKNINDTYISLLNIMGDTNIMEMLNGDAINTAAEAIGIKTTSVANIFEKILGNKYKQYRFAGDLIDFIAYQESKENERLPMINNPDLNDKYYGKKRLLEFEEIKYKYPNVNTLLTDTKEEYNTIKKVNGLAIQRVKDNIKHGTCPVCRLDLDDVGDVIIVKCCNAIFCAECGIKAQNLTNSRNNLQNGRCSNCRTTLNIKDLIYIGDGFNLDNVLEEKFEDDELVDSFKKKKETQTKYTAIIDIIKGNPIVNEKRVDMYIPNMMKGANYLPEAKIRKVLVFANFDETLKDVITELTEEKIKFWQLHGGINEINTIAAAFTDCNTTCALVINSTRHCSGLNLQSATDLIFTHRIIDQSIESQVAGRGHRLGRKNPLNIWYLMYDNEYEILCELRSVRELSNTELQHEKQMEQGIERSVVSEVKDNTNECYLDKPTKLTDKSDRLTTLTTQSVTSPILESDSDSSE